MRDHPFREFRDAHVLVAGVRRDNIGWAIAKGLRQFGARVSIVDKKTHDARSLAKTLGSQPHPVKVYKADLADDIARKNVLKRINAKGLVRYFVSAIGNDERDKDPDAFSGSDFDRLVGSNFKAPYFMAKELIPTMHAAGGGSMLLFTSRHGSDLTDLKVAGYALAKAALNKGIVQLAEAAGMVNEPGNIVRINGFCPGWVSTPEQQRRFAKEFAAAVPLQAIPVKMTPDKLVNTVLAALSNTVSPYMTGAIVTADGGRRSPKEMARPAPEEQVRQ